MNQSYRPAKGRANWATFFLVAHGVITVVSIISTIAEIGLLQRIESGQFVSDAEAIASDNRRTVINWLFVASFIAFAVAFLWWIHLASKNLASLGVRNQRFSPGWAVGWWFIPVMLWFIPYQVMMEVWKGSYPQIGSDGPDAWTDSPASPLIGFWWAAWLICNLISGYLFFFYNATTIDRAIRYDIGLIASDALLLISLTIAVILIRQITSNQDIKRAYNAPVPAVPALFAPAPPAPGGGRYCAQCGTARATTDARFCTHCGNAF